jgi:acyl-coenzyme A thioesterase PaaI-like protein
VTTHLDTEFVKPAPIGTLLAKARVISREERDAVVTAEILDNEGNLCARGVAELRIVRRR